MAELSGLLRSEIPEGRNSLTDNHTNLERVAEYCEANYFQAESKRSALEETKNYTTQSLASVAYQINTLAYNFLQLLELQTGQLAEMESQMNHIAQTVMIHKEKVARREIGVLTANKSTSRQYKIIAPAVPEKPIKYVRRPIDYNVLDDVGHGVRAMNPQRGSMVGAKGSAGSGSGSGGAGVGGGGSMRASSQGSVQSLSGGAGQMVSGGGPNGNGHGVGPGGAMVGPAPTTKPPTPPSVTRTGSKVVSSGGTLSKGSREYRTPPAVAPPQVPSHYAPNYPLGHPRRGGPGAEGSIQPGPPQQPPGGNGPQMQHRGPGYSTLPMAQQQQQMQMHGGQMMSPQQQVGMVHPMTVHQHPQTPPPPPPPNNVGGGLYGDHHNSMPPPPSPLINSSGDGSGTQHHGHQSHSVHSLMMPQHGPVPVGSLGMHTLTHHHAHQLQQQVHLQQQQHAAAAAAAAQQSQYQQQQYGTGPGHRLSRSSGAQSPPLPPPPPPDDTDMVHEAFGRPRTSSGGVGGLGGGLGSSGGGGVMPIVPDEDDLPGWVPKNYIEKVVAIYDYYADKDDELSFQESSVIYVLKKNDDGWWEGVMDGITGLFPGNYVEPCV